MRVDDHLPLRPNGAERRARRDYTDFCPRAARAARLFLNESQVEFRLMRIRIRAWFIIMLMLGALTTVSAPAQAAPKTAFKIAWSIYVGWMPFPYAAESGILKKWADKYGIQIEMGEVNDYVESINQYTAGAFDGVAVTNMDCLTIPSAGGVDTTAIVLGDYSNGNDAVILKRATET